MTKLFFGGAFAIGAIAIIWIGRIFLGVDTLGLIVTLLIAAAFLVGASELLLFRRATATLRAALDTLVEPVNDLESWLSGISTDLQNSVRMRVENGRAGLPGPVITPYLVGLLVMLGLLGTFVGMVDTLKGAVSALEGSSELEAIRAGLAAPIEGLGLAFGTSVAGVAASAMLGLMSTISKRERIQSSQQLDGKITRHLKQFSLSHQQAQAFKSIQEQAQALPEVATQLADLATNLEKMNERVSIQLLDNQTQFQSNVSQSFVELSESVGRSLDTTLVESAKELGNSILPMTESTFKKLDEVAIAAQHQLADAGNEQLSTLTKFTEAQQDHMQASLKTALAQQTKSADALLAKVAAANETAISAFEVNSTGLLSSFENNNAAWAKQQTEHVKEVSALIRSELTELRQQESDRGEAAVAKLGDMESMVAEHLAKLGQALEEPMTRLIETASETPKAAAELIEKMRGEMTKNFERDNDLLSERTRLMAQLDSLSSTLEQSAGGQREAIDLLVSRSAETLGNVGEQFTKHVHTESTKLSEVAEHFASSSAEMASLSDAFNAAVRLFSDSNNQLIENLTRIEASLENANSRSDEQLAYYVAQAREIIDHNLLSHQQIIGALNAKQPTQLSVKGVGS